ncbi:uncharacterized protein PHACADRAFT_210585 [Phanerochaete carnosa HHB-10118-sp]|uniref:Uncharacterized protein n=1 Tax=Phanerochaete carnosa (strain HHB-10118-sp) TaxID=650164 RepID=K5W6Q7_PHACS|nr:uncharacterized protein PHACADRAFT_210585 [Phanerochaete carnosa HHB-10118-sp]EKM54805.1 hypothetical protein PHACADRAFT_210585 [Phanerochaete carnosa HHB-10118-sp]
MTTYGNPQTGLLVVWTDPAKEEVTAMANEERFGGNAVAWHEQKVRKYAEEKDIKATKGRIRKPAHIGGVDPTEREHITVTFKLGSKDLGARHVYTDAK